MDLRIRLSKLEKKRGANNTNTSANLTENELLDDTYELTRELLDAGMATEISPYFLLVEPRCREFVDSEPWWARDRNHRMNVFQGWLRIMYGRVDLQALPNHKRITEIIGRGWYDGEPIPPSDIDWLCAELKDIHLDGEQPWLREYLEHVAFGQTPGGCIIN